MLRRYLMRALCALLPFCIPLAVHGADKKWTAAVSGDFADPARWTGGVPGAGDTASFNDAGTYTVTFDNAPNPLASPVLNQDLFFDAGTATFTSGSGGPYTYRLTGAGGDDALITSGALTLGTSGNPLHLTVDDDLLVRGGATLNVNHGSQVNTLDLVLATTPGVGNNGTIVVDGTNSRLNVNSGSTNIGTNGNTAVLTYRNSSQGTFTGALSLANSGIATSAATLNVESNADLTTGNLSVGIGPAAATGTVNLTGAGSTLTTGNFNVGTGTGGATGTVTLQGGALLTVSGASTMTVGGASGGIGTVNIGTSISTLTTGTGGLTVNATGTINQSTLASGTIIAKGNIVINGGTLNSNGNITFEPGKSLTVQNGGMASLAIHETNSDTIFNVIGAGSEISSDILIINSGAQVNVTSGGTLSAFSQVAIGNDFGETGSLTVDGSGSSVTAVIGRWGQLNGSATATFSNSASGTFSGTIFLANSGTGSALVNVLSDADLSAGAMTLAVNGIATATLNVEGSGSSVSVGPLTVGHASTGSAFVNIGTTASGATLTTGSSPLTINATGTVNIGSGANTGTLNANGDVLLDGGTLTRGAGSTFTLGAGRTMTIQSGGSAQLTGNNYITASNAIYSITGATSNLETGRLLIDDGAQVNVTGGGSVGALTVLDIGSFIGDGTLTVDGSGSSAASSGSGSLWGFSGHTATVTFSNNATGTFNGQIFLAESSSAGTAADVDILSGANLSVGNLILAASGGETTSATLDVQGSGSTVTQTGPDRTLEVGHSSTGTASINIGTTASGAVFTTGTGLFTINTTGTVNIGSGANTGRLDAHGDVLVDGGALQIGSGSSFFLDSGRTMSIQNGGTVSFTAGYAAANANYNISGAGSTMNTGDGLNISSIGGAVLNVSSQGSVSVGGNLRVGVGAAGTLVVDGSGSSASAGAASQWGINSGTGNVTFSNGAAGSFPNGLSLATNALPNSTAIVNILSGANLATGNLTLANVGGETTSATLTIDGAGSTVTPGGIVTIGHAAEGTADINVLNSGALTVGAGGSTMLNTTGSINIDGGSVNLKTLTDSGGTINFIAGSLSYLGNLTVGSGGLLGENLTLASNRQLTLSGATTIDAGRTLTLDGGLLSTGSLVVNGAFHFDRGTLEITGGTISGLGNLAVNTNAEFRASGVQSLQIIGLTASTIRAIDDLTLGDSTKVNGFYSNGTVDVGAHTVTLADANDAVFDSAALVTLGDGGTPGTLAAANGLTLDFGGNVTGFGTMNTPNDLFRPLINNGHITGNSGAEPITLTGYVKGVGSFDNVTFTGAFDPGLSPTLLTVGSTAFGPTNTLIMEVGGTSRGSQYDAILASGALNLDGTLAVTLINGFAPSLGNTFEVLRADGGIFGAFATEVLPALTAGLEWNVVYSNFSVLLEVAASGVPGDYNQNGTVDAADYVLWRKTLGQTGPGLAADGNGNQQIDAGDYNVWRANFGRVAVAGAGSNSDFSTAVPEPGALIFALLAALCGVPIFQRRRRRR